MKIAHTSAWILALVGATACASSGTSPTTRRLTQGAFRFELKVFEPTRPKRGVANTETHAIARHPSGDLLVTGHTTGPLELDLDAPISAGAAFVARVDPSGRVVWAREVEGARVLVTASPDGRVFTAATPAVGDGLASEPADDPLTITARAPDGEVLWSRAPRLRGAVFSLTRIAHHGGELLVMGGALNEPDVEPWEIPTTNPGAGVVTWWRDSDGALERSYTFGGRGEDRVTDALHLEGGDVLVVGHGEGRVELSEGESLEHEGRYGIAVRITPAGAVAWKRAWPASGYGSYSEARRIIRTEEGVAVVGQFGGDIDLYAGMGAEDAFGRVFVEELTPSGEHVNQYVVDGYNDDTRLAGAEPMADGTIALGLTLRGGYANGPPTIELTDGPIAPLVETNMNAVVRLDLDRGHLALIERWDGLPGSERPGVVELAGMSSGDGRLYVAGTLWGESMMGEREVRTMRYEPDPCEVARRGGVRLVKGGPYVCRPYYVTGVIGFIQRVELD